MNDEDVLQNASMSPFSPSKNKRRMSESQRGKVSKFYISEMAFKIKICIQGKSPKKRKVEDKFADSKSLKTEESPFKTKKPIRLKKTVHPRKKLQPNQDLVKCPKIVDLIYNQRSLQILDEDASSSGARTPTKRKSRNLNGVDYDDVYTRKGNLLLQ